MDQAFSSQGQSLIRAVLMGEGEDGTLQPVKLTEGGLFNQATRVIPVTEGGTGNSSLTSGAIVLGAGTSPVTTVGPGSTGQIAISSGTTFAMQSLSGGATVTAAGVVTLDLTNSNVTGPLPVTKGGTGVATVTSGALITGAGTSAVVAVGPGTTGQIPISNGTTISMNSMSGDATLASNGAITLATVPLAKGGTGQTTNTKGDLLAASGSAWNKLSVGTNGQLLIADSAQTNGVGWSTLTNVYPYQVTNASPGAVTINGAGGSGTDIAGANLVLAGGRPTGSGAAGLVVLKKPLIGATGTTLRSLSTQSYPVSSTLFSGNISDVTVTASTVSTTETTLLGTVTGSKSVEGGMIRPGAGFRVIMSGVYTTSVTPPTQRFRIKIGSVAVLDASAASYFSDSQSGREWQIEANILCKTTGASGTYKGFASIKEGAATSTWAMRSTSSTVDTTSTNDIDVTIQWSTNTAGNSCTLSNIIVEHIN